MFFVNMTQLFQAGMDKLRPKSHMQISIIVLFTTLIVLFTRKQCKFVEILL